MEMTKRERIYDIYEKFSQQLIEYGWRGVFFDWKETVMCKVNGDGYSTFEYGNGFRLTMIEYTESDNLTCLMYWFENNEGRKDVYVDNIEQLQALLD